MTQGNSGRKNWKRNPGYSIEDLVGPNFWERYNNRELGKEWVDTVIGGLEKSWTDLDDYHKKNIIGIGNFLGNAYNEARSISPDEKWNPLAYIEAGAVRGIEGVVNTVGKVSDFVIGNPARGAGWLLGLDPRLREGMAIGAQLYFGPKALKGVKKIKPKHLGITTKIEPYVPPTQIGNTKQLINITADAVDETFNLNPEIFRQANKIYKANPNIGMKKAIQEAKLLSGFKPSQLITGDLPLNKIMGRIQKIAKDRNIPPDLKMSIIQNNTGLPGRGKNESYPDYVRRMLTTYGARPDENGNLVMTTEAFGNIKNPNIRREIAQLILTPLSQGVKGSFLKQKLPKNAKLNKDLEAYNKKYGARADLHHGYPSVIGIEFYLDNPHMGTQWKEYQAIADKYNNVPGQPMVDGRDNLVSLPSSIPSTITNRKTKEKTPNPDYVEAKEGLKKLGRKIPQHLHQIIHDSFLTNEMGQTGQKFWEKWEPIIIQKGKKGWLEAYEAFNEIIARNRAMYNEALAQLEIFFSKASLSENPEKLVELLEEYIAKGKITIGQGLVRDKDGNVVITKEGTDTALSTMKFVEYQQDAVQYIVEDALRDFKKDANKLLENDPRLKDVAAEVAEIPGLTQAEIKRAEELLFKIKYYNSILLTDGKSRAYQVTRISAAQHKKHVDEYYELIQLKLPIEVPKGFIQLSVFKNTKLPDLNRQLELILDQQLELDL